MIDEGASELEVVKVGEGEVGYAKEVEEEEEGRSLSTFSDKEGESKDLASLEKFGSGEMGEDGFVSVSKTVPDPRSGLKGHPTGEVSDDDETSYENDKKLINGKVRDLSLGSHPDEGLVTSVEAASEEGEEPGENLDSVAENFIADKTDNQGIKGIPRIPRRRSRSPSLEEGQSVEDVSKIGGSFSPHSSGTFDSAHKKRRKRSSSGWDTQNNNSCNSPNLAPLQGSSVNPHTHFSGVSGALSGNSGAAAGSNPSLGINTGHSNMGPGGGMGVGPVVTPGTAPGGVGGGGVGG
ncbi:ribonucleoprotein-binding protein, partial [Cryptosporidium felis]